MTRSIEVGGFAALDVEAKAYRYRRGRQYVVHIELHDDRQNFRLGHAIEAGERIVAVQHGGGYGWSAIMPLPAESEYQQDAFVTWGWTHHMGYEGRFVPLPSPLLSRGLKRSGRPTYDIVLIGGLVHAFNPRIDFYPDALEYRRWKRRFVGALDPAIAAGLHYRPYVFEGAFADEAWLRSFFPELRIMDGDLNERIFQCRLIVLDHPSTTLAQALAANRPTIGFWDKTAWPLAPEAEPLFVLLEQVGILFDSPEKAAAQVNAVLTDLDAWWADAERQIARKAWCDRFARADRGWWIRWLKALAAL